ncbi:hypothetical protein BURPS1655_A1830 [Burkholderia pseudomallei 1655]|nr:hypothetical protein CXQ84_11330 [Burkholderia pseudomallei]EDU07392.1 hypothetical protein BURPS1655_A1830 [Burkholderia pseudomallei 1655]
MVARAASRAVRRAVRERGRQARRANGARQARRAACDAGVSRGSRLAALGARRIVLESSNE